MAVRPDDSSFADRPGGAVPVRHFSLSRARSGPVAPNLLVGFREPVVVRLPGLVAKPIRMLALCVDDPAGAATALDSLASRGPARAPSPEQAGWRSGRVEAE